MCWPNIFSLFQRKSQNLCEGLRLAMKCRRHLSPQRQLRLLNLLPKHPIRLSLPLLALPLSLSSQLAFAQVERRELPALPGTESESPSPSPSPRPKILSPSGSGERASSESPLPSDLWHGVDAAELEKLLKGAPLPSASPTLSDLIARALALGATNGNELAVRLDALAKIGRIDEEAGLLASATQSGEPGAAALHAAALLEAGRVDEACAVAVEPPPESAGAKASATR